jgi:hypothetical protein
MQFRSRAIVAAAAAAALTSIVPRADAQTWYWVNGAKCQVSAHPPAYELAQTKALGARVVETKPGRIEIVLPSLEAYKPFIAKGFHFIFFKTEPACNAYLQEEARIQSDEQRAHQEYEQELKTK